MLTDFPEVNLRLAAIAKRREVPTMYLAPPQAWAWRPTRVRSLQGVDFVGCLFPFSADWYAERGVNAHWIGHPLALEDPPTTNQSGIVTLMPGSRLTTVKRILPSMGRLVDHLSRQVPDLMFRCARSPDIPNEVLAAAFEPINTSVDIFDE